ncbi:MAG: hypothetical protein HeimC2_27410 [Candidatus Heimdallarchaeota archaeon LC_2]|nr:MAG: hypothetical protein HeimC2_27410 [Candidatus Heimdallarchaeota archaeon LC_2]
MPVDEKIITAYNNARDYLESRFGEAPEDYMVLFFLDPSVYQSVLLQTQSAGTPRAIISSNELQVLQHLKDEDFVASGVDLMYASRKPKIFFPSIHNQNALHPKIWEAKFVQALGKALLCEKTKSRFPHTLEKLYEYDSIIYNLFTNNVYEFVRERNAGWVWQYFQDFTATIRLLSLYNLDDFYVPPSSIRSASMFYNYLLEIKNIISKRAKAVTSAPLFDLILNGFGDFVLNDYLKEMDTDVQTQLIPHLKSNLGQPMGVLGSHFIHANIEDEKSVLDTVINLKNDYELVKIWSRKETKVEVELIRENLSNRSMVWHGSKHSYWSDLWPLRASIFDKTSAYIGKIQRRKFKSFNELLLDSPLVTTHGRVQLSDREVAVFGMQEDTVGQEQLLILRNHLEAKKDTFSTPLPGLPDVIVFKKFAGMHVASYLGIADKDSKRDYPKSPYDLPVVVRAVQVTRKKDAYVSIERDDGGKIDTADYQNLSKLTEPQHRAIRYLIRQSEVLQ